MLRILDFIENTLKVHWQDHEGFVALQERVLALRMILEEAGDKPLEGMSRICLINLTLEQIANWKYVSFIQLYCQSYVMLMRMDICFGSISESRKCKRMSII